MMLSILGSLLLGFIFVLTYWFFKGSKSRKNYPPGPYGIPVLGYLPFIDHNAHHKSITNLSKVYGDVFSLKLGSQDVVYINSYDAAKEAFNHPYIQDILTYKNLPPSFLAGERLFSKLHPRFTLNLEDFGIENARLETVIADEAEKLVLKFGENLGEPFDISEALNSTIANAIWKMIASLQVTENDPNYKMLVKELKEAMEVFSSCILDDFTWGVSLFPNWTAKRNSVQTLNKNMDLFIQKLIDDHEETLDLQNPRDFIDAFLVKKREDTMNGVKDSWFQYDGLKTNMLHLLVNHAEPLATALKGAILLLSQHPGMQTEIKKEIHKLTEGQRRVSLQDRNMLPQLEAFILETHRQCIIAAFGLPQFTTENTTLGEFQIPKGTLIIVNMSALHFQGKRPEEQLPRAELFLFLGYLLQDFTFSLPTDAPPVSVNDTTRLMHPSSYDVLAIQTQSYNV